MCSYLDRSFCYEQLRDFAQAEKDLLTAKRLMEEGGLSSNQLQGRIKHSQARITSKLGEKQKAIGMYE